MKTLTNPRIDPPSHLRGDPHRLGFMAMLKLRFGHPNAAQMQRDMLMATMIPQPTERFSFQQALHGAGGFAKIIRGKDNALDREIAVKVLDPLLGSEFSETDRERFRREARILAKLSHPNIPAIYDVNFASSGEYVGDLTGFSAGIG